MKIIHQLRWAAAVLGVACSSTLGQQNQIVSIGHKAPTPYPYSAVVAAGEVVTLFTTAIDVPDAVATQTPLPTTLSGVSVLVRVIGASDTRGYPTSLPILRVTRVGLDPNGTCKTNPNTTVFCSHSEITVQIPTEGVCATPGPVAPPPCPANPPFPEYPPLLILNVKANGVTGPDLPVAHFAPSQLLESCDAMFGTQPSYVCHPLVTHADGTLVSAANPAHVGETITIYATGLGDSPGGPQTGTAEAKPASIQPASGIVSFKYPYPLEGYGPNVSAQTSTSVTPGWVGYTGGYVGLFQINAKVPPAPGGVYQPCSNYATDLGGNTWVVTAVPGNTVSICVQP
jgi:uncharacterized protein (TIGR03437 family)